MEFDNISYRLLFVNSDKNNQNYKNLENEIKSGSLQDEMQKKHIQIGANIIDDTPFKMHLYDFGGNLIKSMDSFNINEINKTLNDLDVPQKGGNRKRTYKEKYEDYKKIYKELKTAIIKFSF